jgi:transcriptional regulator with XRE-family HTH domain
MPTLQEVVRFALAEVPGSLRAIAREAGVPHSTLVRIRQGDRDATREVAEALADALGRWAADCRSAELSLREFLTQEVDNE